MLFGVEGLGDKFIFISVSCTLYNTPPPPKIPRFGHRDPVACGNRRESGGRGSLEGEVKIVFRWPTVWPGRFRCAMDADPRHAGPEALATTPVPFWTGRCRETKRPVLWGLSLFPATRYRMLFHSFAKAESPVFVIGLLGSQHFISNCEKECILRIRGACFFAHGHGDDGNCEPVNPCVSNPCRLRSNPAPHQNFQLRD